MIIIMRGTKGTLSPVKIMCVKHLLEVIPAGGN